VSRLTLGLAVAAAVLLLVVVFLVGQATGGSDVTVKDCDPVEQSGWEFQGC
jgi:hypothetical protein